MEPYFRSKQPVKFSDLEVKTLVVREESGDRIYEAVDRSNGTIYALRKFSRHYDVNERENIRQEIETLKSMHHPNLVECHQMFEIDGRIHLLFEHMDLGSLIGADITDESSLAIVARQLIAGVDYLHRRGISHGDIKPSNVLVNSSKQVKVMYLGKILSLTSGRTLFPGVGAEGLESIYDEFSWDIWNVGLTLLKLSKGSFWAYKASDFEGEVDLLQVFETSPVVGTPMKKSSKNMWSFLLCCMRTDLSKRWTMRELSQHHFLQQYSPGQIPRNSLIPTKRNLSAPLSLVSDITQSSKGEQMYRPQKKKRSSSFIDIISFITDTSTSNVQYSRPNINNSQDYARCVQHCSLFPQGFEFEKDKMIQLWIAEECVKGSVPERVEDVASLYFDALVNEEVIIPTKFDNLYGQMKYKLNACKSCGPDTQAGYLQINDGECGDIGSALHLSLHCKKVDRTVFDALKNLKQLRTLILLGDGFRSIKEIPNYLFPGFKLLKTLDLSFSSISDLPSSVGSLESLKFLDLSETPIKLLPESTDRLRFLQTMRLRGCVRLRALPRELRKLVNLRHLDLDIFRQLNAMPKGMGNLTKLQTLKAFIVGKNEGCSIIELQNMNDITGSFCISRLENVSSVDEAKEAAMDKKKHISKLELRWNDQTSENLDIQVEILEQLQPHFGLKELDILFYSGSLLPTWISNPFFTDLTSLSLYRCINCQILPSIGELPSLKFLMIVGMNNVKDINCVFYRKQGTKGGNAFPKLEKLTMDEMLNLEKWTGLEDGDFPCLTHITIRYCPKLICLPILSRLPPLLNLEISHCTQLSFTEGGLPSSLMSLIIRDCPKISAESLRGGGEDLFNIAKVRNIWIDFKEISLD